MIYINFHHKLFEIVNLFKKIKKKEAISKNIAVKLSKCLRINVYILIPSQTFKKESSNIKCLKIKNKKLKKSLMSNQ